MMTVCPPAAAAKAGGRDAEKRPKPRQNTAKRYKTERSGMRVMIQAPKGVLQVQVVGKRSMGGRGIVDLIKNIDMLTDHYSFFFCGQLAT